MTKIGVYYQPGQRAAHAFADELRAEIERNGQETWTCAVWDERATEQLSGTELIICVGGDGTMLRAARIVVPHVVPLLGVNMGRLGFLTELRPDEARQRLPEILAGKARTEERSMLQVRVGPGESMTQEPVHALNDVVVGRRSLGRPIYVEVSIDGDPFTTYRADAVLVASATGSTGYNLSAHGPILHPESSELILTPVAPHLSLARSLVLPAEAEISMLVRSDHAAALSIDGQEVIIRSAGDTVQVSRSPHKARFLRFGAPQHFYTTIGRQLMSITNPAAPAADRPGRLENRRDP